MKTLLALFLLALTVFAADDRQHIETLRTATGKTFHQVVISKVTASEIRFTHADGIASVPMKDLPDDVQKLFGFDPVAAQFEMINAQDEKKKALEEQQKRKAEQTEIRIRQQAEHIAIQAIEKRALQVSLLVQGLTAEGSAKCKAWGVGYKELKGGKKTAAKKTMSGEFERVQVLTDLPLPGVPNSYLGGQGVIVHGIKPDVVGKQVVMLVYPIGEAKKGEIQHYATDCSIAYGILKTQGKIAQTAP